MELTDNELIEQTLHGETEAFGILVRRWERQIYSLALRVLGHEEDARDVCQETFLSAFRHLKKFRGDAQFSSWIYRIALNLCNTKMRRAQSRPDVPLEQHLETTGAEPVAETEELGANIQQQEVAQYVRKALAGLPPEMRQVIIMKEYEGLKFVEIAEILNIPVSTVKTRLYTGLAQLKKRLAHLQNAIR